MPALLDRHLGVFRNRMIAVAGLGGLNVLAFSPFDLAWLPFVSIALFLYLLEGQAPRKAAWLGFAFGFAWFAIGTHWLYLSLHVFGKLPLILACVLMLGLAAIMALYYAGFAWLLNRFWPTNTWRRHLLAAPGLWVAIEWLRSWFLSGFPWFSLGYSQVDTWLAAYAPVGGVFLASLAVVFIASAIRLSFMNRLAMRLAAAVLTLGIVAGGYLLQSAEWTEADGRTLRVALIQGNVAQDEKWLPQNRIPTMQKYWQLTRDVVADVDLVVWPEAAIPVLYSQVASTYFSQVETELLNGDQRLLTGILVHDPEAQVYYNSSVVLGDADRRFYNKRHLVPFGEYFPVPDFVRNWLRLMNLPYSDFAEGSSSNALMLRKGSTAAMMICYEAVFGSEAAIGAGDSGVLINISNDGWFGRSIGPKQHFQIARMRSIETGRPLLRATNTGLTAVVDFRGRVVEQLPAFEAGSLVARVEPRRLSTPFVSYGVLILFSLLLPLLVAGAMRR